MKASALVPLLKFEVESEGETSNIDNAEMIYTVQDVMCELYVCMCFLHGV